MLGKAPAQPKEVTTGLKPAVRLHLSCSPNPREHSQQCQGRETLASCWSETRVKGDAGSCHCSTQVYHLSQGSPKEAPSAVYCLLGWVDGCSEHCGRAAGCLKVPGQSMEQGLGAGLGRVHCTITSSKSHCKKKGSGGGTAGYEGAPGKHGSLLAAQGLHSLSPERGIGCRNYSVLPFSMTTQAKLKAEQCWFPFFACTSLPTQAT